MVRNPLIRRIPKMTGKTTGGHKSAGILDDHAIRKVIHSKEGIYKEIWSATDPLILGKVGTTELGDGTLRLFRPQTDLKIDLGDATHRFNDTHIGGDVLLTGGGLEFGEIWVEGNATADTIATATNTQVLRFANNGESNGTTPDHTNDHITVATDGKYMITVSVSFSGDASVDWSFGVYKNNGGTAFSNVHCNRKLGSGGDIGSAGLTGIIDVSANDTIELWMQHGAGVNKDITIQDCTLSLVKVGG